MRYLFGFMCVCALAIAGCGDDGGGPGGVGGGGTGGDGGSAGSGSSGGVDGICDSSLGSPTLAAVCPCSEAGIRAAIEAPADDDPFKFDCNGPQTVVTEATIVIDNDVILDGEGNLTVVGTDNPVFRVAEDVTTELRGFGVTAGGSGAGIVNWGTLSLWDCTVSEGGDIAIDNGAQAGLGFLGYRGTLTLTNSTVSANAHGIWNRPGSDVMLTKTTVSGNVQEGIRNFGGLVRLVNSTVSENTAEQGALINDAEGVMTLTHTIVDGNCVGDGVVASGGYNIESPADTCGLNTNKGDQVNVSAEDLDLATLQDNGGPTMTHALLPGSVAIARIPKPECLLDLAVLTTDQRGVDRPQGAMCDVGAFERQASD